MIDFRLKISKQYLHDAEILIARNSVNSAISRIYYASYQAMWSALGNPVDGKIWRHLAVIKHFVRGYWYKPDHPRELPGLFEHLRLPLRQLYISRIKADYDGIPIKTKFAKQAVDTVRKTIEIIEDLGGKK
jgi:uncharacterized protein (UPF0332 family)